MIRKRNREPAAPAAPEPSMEQKLELEEKLYLGEPAPPAPQSGKVLTDLSYWQCPKDEQHPLTFKGLPFSARQPYCQVCSDSGHREYAVFRPKPAGQPTPPAPAWEDEVMRIVKATESFDPENLEIYKAAAIFAAEFAKYKLASVEQELATERQQVEQLCGDVKAIQHDYTNAVKRNRELEEALTKIQDGNEHCQCDHTNEGCCAKIGVYCPYCIAEAALAKGSE